MAVRTGLVAGILLLAPVCGAAAQQSDQSVEQAAPQPADMAATYAAIARLPRFEGVWQAEWTSITRLRAAEAEAPLTPEARARRDAFQQAKQNGENLQTEGANCMPSGLPGSMRYPYPVEIIYSGHKVNIVIETHSQLRQIFTDGRPLPEDPDPLFNGSSVGRWEGGVLQVETIGLTPLISLMEGLHPTPSTRISESIWLDGPGRLLVRTTITDPALFTQPFVSELAYHLEPDWTLREYVCQENNRDAADELGRPSMDLGLDAFGPLPTE